MYGHSECQWCSYPISIHVACSLKVLKLGVQDLQRVQDMCTKFPFQYAVLRFHTLIVANGDTSDAVVVLQCDTKVTYKFGVGKDKIGR